MEPRHPPRPPKHQQAVCHLGFRRPRGKEQFLALARICDVLVENHRGSIIDRLALGYDVVSQPNPQLISSPLEGED